MKTKHMVIRGAVILIMAVLFATTSIAQQGKGKGECNSAYGTCEHVIPDLTDDQQQEIKKLRIDHQVKMLAFKADINILKAELYKLEIAEKPDISKITNKIEELGAVKIQVAKEKSIHRLDVRSLLTKEQLVMFDNRIGKRAGKCKRY